MVIIKIIISVSIIAIAAILGARKSKKYSDREYILNEAILVFNNIKSNIKYKCISIPNAIEEARINLKTELKNVLGSISISMIDNGINERLVLEELDNLYSLKQYDKILISNLICSLGSSSIDGEISTIMLGITNLEEELKEAREEKIKNTKLYKTVGIVCGLMLVIIFI